MKDTYEIASGFEMEAHGRISDVTEKVIKLVTRFLAFIVMIIGDMIGFILNLVVTFFVRTFLIIKGSWYTNFQSEEDNV